MNKILLLTLALSSFPMAIVSMQNSRREAAKETQSTSEMRTLQNEIRESLNKKKYSSRFKNAFLQAHKKQLQKLPSVEEQMKTIIETEEFQNIPLSPKKTPKQRMIDIIQEYDARNNQP